MLVVFKARNSSLHLSLVVLLVRINTLEVVELILDAVSFSRYLIDVAISVFKLTSDVVDMPFESHDLLHKVFLFLLSFCDLEGCTTHLFLSILKLIVEVLVLLRDLVDSRLKSLNLQARISVIGQDVFFLKLKCPCLLSSSSLLVSKFVVLVL